MSNKGEIAKEYFLAGYNCAQAVALAFCDEIGLDKALIASLTSGFGGGMGRMREVCGSVSGAVFVLSAIEGYSNPKDNERKKQLYQSIQEIGRQFKDENGSIICRELLGLSTNDFDHPTPSERTAQYYKKRPCAEIVKSSANILEQYIIENKK